MDIPCPHIGVVDKVKLLMSRENLTVTDTDSRYERYIQSIFIRVVAAGHVFDLVGARGKNNARPSYWNQRLKVKYLYELLTITAAKYFLFNLEKCNLFLKKLDPLLPLSCSVILCNVHVCEYTEGIRKKVLPCHND